MLFSCQLTLLVDVRGAQWSIFTLTYGLSSPIILTHTVSSKPVSAPSVCCPSLSQLLTLPHMMNTCNVVCYVWGSRGRVCHLVRQQEFRWQPCCLLALRQLIHDLVRCTLASFLWSHLKGVSYSACGIRSVMSVCVAIRCSWVTSSCKLPQLVTGVCAQFSVVSPPSLTLPFPSCLP